MTTYSPVKHQEKRLQNFNNVTPNNHAQCVSDIPVRLFNLHTTAKVYPESNEYMCSDIVDKYAQSANCFKNQ